MYYAVLLTVISDCKNIVLVHAELIVFLTKYLYNKL
jgi:hypothetical protein